MYTAKKKKIWVSAHLHPVARGIVEAKFSKGDSHIRGRAVGPSVNKRHRIRVILSVDRQDRAGPNLDASVLWVF